MTIMAILQRYAPAVIWISLSVTVIALVFIGRSLPMVRIIALLNARLVGSGFWGPIVFGLLCVIATLLFVPVVVLTLSAGVLFGLWVGTLIVSLASTASAALTFLTARYVTRVKVRRWIQEQPQLYAVDKALEHGGWKVVVLLRLSALFPFSLQNYLYGLTPIGFWPYLLSTWLAMLPGIFVCVYIGQATEAAVSSHTHDQITSEWIALGVGLVATVAVSVYLTSLAKKHLRERGLKDRADKEAMAREEKARTVQSTWSVWRATVAVLVALLMAGAAAYTQLNPDALVSLFRECRD